MTPGLHRFHIPVMGTGHSIDSPIRVAHFGISSVVSLVDDILIHKVCNFYREKYGLPEIEVAKRDLDGRAKRITVYLDTVQEIVTRNMEAVRALPFFQANDKAKYFEMLPDDGLLKQDYSRLLAMGEGPEQDALAESLTARMVPGSIDVNIMVKLDRTNYNHDGSPLSKEFSDSLAALRGYANSGLESSIVLSAGLNQRLFNYMCTFDDFYRDRSGNIKKKIVLKVNDFRSALIQAKVLAKKGLEVSEFRVESGLNCGGHAFPSNGNLLPHVLREFQEKQGQIARTVKPLVLKYYSSKGWVYPGEDEDRQSLLSVQGGIGTHGEVRRLREEFGIEQTGWATPFLLVPEATCVDDPTRDVLKNAREKDLYLSNISPLGIPFNTVHRTGSELWTLRRAEEGKHGSPCPKGYLISNTEFTDGAICLASRRYQKLKLDEIDNKALELDEKKKLRVAVIEKTCICDHLGNGALIALGISGDRLPPQSICPGPNICWFDRDYSLREMVDHIYGRIPSLVPPERPHMCAKEASMFVEYFEKQVADSSGSPREVKTLKEFKKNMEVGIDICLEIAAKEPFKDENLASIPPCMEQLRERLDAAFARLEETSKPLELAGAGAT